jgi:hypothetical protein
MIRLSDKIILLVVYLFICLATVYKWSEFRTKLFLDALILST